MKKVKQTIFVQSTEGCWPGHRNWAAADKRVHFLCCIFRLLLLLAVVDTVHLVTSLLSFCLPAISSSFRLHLYHLALPYTLPLAQVGSCISLRIFSYFESNRLKQSRENFWFNICPTKLIILKLNTFGSINKIILLIYDVPDRKEPVQNLHIFNVKEILHGICCYFTYINIYLLI